MSSVNTLTATSKVSPKQICTHFSFLHSVKAEMAWLYYSHQARPVKLTPSNGTAVVVVVFDVAVVLVFENFLVKTNDINQRNQYYNVNEADIEYVYLKS